MTLSTDLTSLHVIGPYVMHNANIYSLMFTLVVLLCHTIHLKLSDKGSLKQTIEIQKRNFVLFETEPEAESCIFEMGHYSFY